MWDGDLGCLNAAKYCTELLKNNVENRQLCNLQSRLKVQGESHKRGQALRWNV